jgi:hypothetical protein
MENTVISMYEVQIKRFIESRRPADEKIRKQVDLGYSFDGQIAILFEIRPQWSDPTKIMHSPFAKLQYVKSKKIWKLYWMRASGNWESYQPQPTDPDLDAVLTVIGDDERNCFFG